MFRAAMAAAAVLASSGCASIIHDSAHPLRIETARADGTLVAGAECRLNGGYGTTTLRSGETVPIRRSASDVDVVCSHADNADARGRLVSRANAGLAGNIIFGGIVGAVIDHSKGTAYTYPTWIRLTFGKLLVFDRRAEADGMPVLGVDPDAAK